MHELLSSTAVIVALASALVPAPARAQDPCAVASDAADVNGIEVSPRGAAPFTVEVRGLPVQARATASPTRVDLRVGGPLSFEGRVRELSLRPVRPVRVAGGLVTLATEARLGRPRCVGSALRVHAEPYLGVHLEAVRVPAAALTIDAPERLPLPSPSWESERVFLPRAGRIVVRASSRGGASVALRVELPQLLPLERLARANGASRVRARWSDGSAIEGWVDDDAIELMQGYTSATPAFPIGHGCGTTGGCGGMALYCGPARLAPGTVVTATPEGGAWARAEQEVEVEVRWIRAEAWATVTRLPGVSDEGLCGQTGNAYVPASALTLP